MVAGTSLSVRYTYIVCLVNCLTVANLKENQTKDKQLS